MNYLFRNDSCAKYLWWITLKDGLHGHGIARKRSTFFIFTRGGVWLVLSRPFRITVKIPLAEIGPMESRNPI